MGFVGLRASSDQEELLTLDGAAFSLVMREAWMTHPEECTILPTGTPPTLLPERHGEEDFGSSKAHTIEAKDMLEIFSLW